jgi:hypothetical protein
MRDAGRSKNCFRVGDDTRNVVYIRSQLRAKQ